MDKQNKIKLILSLILIVFGTIASIYVSTFLHQILSNKTSSVNVFSFNFLDCIKSIKVNNNHFMLFISIELLIILGGLFFLLVNNKPYESDLIKVTPTISIPVPAGQKQFGSARFMTEKEKEKAFPISILNKNDKLIEYLIEHGYDDLSELSTENKGGDKNDK